MDRKRLLKNPLLLVAVVVLLYFAFTTIFNGDRAYTQVPISQAMTQVTINHVKEATLEDKEQQLKLTLTDKIEVDGQQVDHVIAPYPANASDQIYTALLNAKVADQPIKFETTVTQ